MQTLRILHVEDEADIREIAAISFGLDSEIELCSVSSGHEALCTLSAGFEPDLILLDVIMPGLDGPSTLTRIRALPRHAGTPVIFMTARTQAHEKHRYLSLGAIGIITKPFDPMNLAREVRCILTEGVQ